MESPFEGEISKFLNVGNDFKVFKTLCKPNCTYQRPRCHPEATGLRLVYNTMLFLSGLERNVETKSTLHVRKLKSRDLPEASTKNPWASCVQSQSQGLSCLSFCLTAGGRLRETLVGGMGRRHISGGWAPPPRQVDLSRQPGTAALSCRMLRVILQKRPQARECALPGGQRREGQRELGPFDDHLCHPSSSPAPPTPHPAYSGEQSQWLWRQPKDSHSSPYHDRLGRGRQKLLGFPEVSHFTTGTDRFPHCSLSFCRQRLC